MDKYSLGVVMIHSQDWVIKSALISLCQHNYAAVNIISAPRNVDEFVEKAIALQPIFIVLDLPPRNSVALIFTLRKQCVNTILILTQETFLFSDRMVGEYFSGVRLKNYDDFMTASPLLFDEVRTARHVLREENDVVCPYPHALGISGVLMAITQLMYIRFAQLVDSPRAQEVVLGWLVKGFEPIAISQILGCSRKVVYHYRLVAMKVLGIRNRTRDFIASLVVTAGPISHHQSVSYQVRKPPETKILDNIEQ
ncbi:hypothetical protein EYY93_09910 [Hafnia paralvei]|jgi:hypothetical protein|uniref:hypothetical protein n=1 Tax=Hafnia paralvei TaxID=546367 RepID=UPI00103457C1|nr:hypothetical protein [Hafnia paralvei]MDX6840841.1 hypothetical protein [Hafnia paralvei]TBM01121.1 hypothetical protein EYY93_09910 [Hafnia paralvei]TBM21894.1 hypothetical protein EYY85_20790 [Hafnia paralvei]